MEKKRWGETEWSTLFSNIPMPTGPWVFQQYVQETMPWIWSRTTANYKKENILNRIKSDLKELRHGLCILKK